MPTLRITTNLPKYAQEMLWLVGTDAYQTKIQGEQAENIPQGALWLRWGTPDGSALMQWPAGTENLVWDGQVSVSGFVEVSHLLTRDNLDLMVVEVSGHPRDTSALRLPTRADLQQKPFKRDDFVAETDESRHWYAFLLPLESPLSDFAHHALVNGYAVDCFGTLADDAAGFEQWLGLPLLLESMTLYSPL
jgi:hypothetical protein